ncbi:MAG: ABC transporter permease subunit [Anaeroplasmataceae bacterium]|nr:ABC transporter permease subunit [Anaeroplasmataceae bacterium]
MKKLFNSILYSLAVILIVLLVWYFASLIINVELILPTPYIAFKNIGTYLISGEFWISLGWTYLRCIESFLIAFVIALLLAVLAYLFPTVEKLASPFMAIVRAIPTMAILLILIISLRPYQTPIVVAGIVICPTLFQSFLSSFKSIDLQLVEMVEVYLVPKSKQILKFYIPSILPGIFSNSASSFSLNIKLIIAAEALAQTSKSIGKMMQYAKINIEIEKLFALAIIAIVISILSEALIRLVQRLVLKND